MFLCLHKAALKAADVSQMLPPLHRGNVGPAVLQELLHMGSGCRHVGVELKLSLKNSEEHWEHPENLEHWVHQEPREEAGS